MADLEFKSIASESLIGDRTMNIYTGTVRGRLIVWVIIEFSDRLKVPPVSVLRYGSSFTTIAEAVAAARFQADDVIVGKVLAS